MRNNSNAAQEQQVVRARTPAKGEVIGMIEEMLGASRFRVACVDSRMRICRVSGKNKRNMWLRTGDVILVEPWSVQPEDRGDIIWKYTAAQVDWLRRNGFLKE
jgi:translation initiation factor 1A